jgi:hypothetical protein
MAEYDEPTHSLDGPTCPWCLTVANPADDPSCYTEEEAAFFCETCEKDYWLTAAVSWAWSSQKYGPDERG